MKRLRLVLAVIAVGGLVSVGPSASADCAAPSLEVGVSEVAAGEPLRISGHAWGDACNDTSGPGPCNPPPLGNPIQDITLELRNKETGTRYDLATVDANEEYAFDVTVIVPQVPARRYELSDSRDQGHYADRPLRVRKSS